MFGAIAAWVIGFGFAAARLASKRRRSVPAWAVLGAILGPVALILLLAAPMGHCPMCWAPVRGWVSWCAWCGSDVRHPPRSEVEPPRMPTPEAAPTPRGVAAARPGPTPTRATLAAAARRASAAPARTTASRSADTRSATRIASPSSVTTTGPGAIEILASGVYVTGSVGLRAGSWYSLEFEGDVFRVRGPLDEDARAIAVTRPLEALEALAFNGRLVVNGPRETVMVFMRLSGASADSIAESITKAARTSATAAG